MTESRSIVDDDAQFRKAVFKIESGSQSGTGFLTQDKQHILTACHVVEGIQLKQEVTVYAVDTNNTFNAYVQKKLPQWDIALLWVEKPIENAPCLQLSPDRVLAAGYKFRTYGFPQEYPPDWHSGTITGELDDGKCSFSFNTSFTYPLEGLSGGPVVVGQPKDSSDDQRYSVVGIMAEHGYDYGFTNNLERGKIVPTSAFYQEILDALAAEMPRKPDIWCYVVRSEADRNLENSVYSLWQVVEDTMSLLQNVSEDDPQDIVKVIRYPEYVYATDSVSSAGNYKDAVEKLCRAKIAIFDITNYEPAVMLLLGIRSVVRRGVTITSIGDKFVIGDSIDIPFNIKELSITSHSEEQHKLKGEEPPYLLNKKIRDGLRQLDTLPQYLDMPTFDAVRNLPPKYRAPDDDNVLVLCSYSEKYQEVNWNFLSLRMRLRLDAKKDPKKAAKIYRVLDVMSPRLVSHAIYEAIRSMALCIVDWTEWRPNVFFELGVRLAVTKPTNHTVCTIDERYKQLVPQINQRIDEFKEDTARADTLIRRLAGVDTKDPKEFYKIRDRYLLIAAQCQYLLNLFDPLEYNPPTKNPSIKDLEKEFLYTSKATDNIVYHDIMYYYHSEKEPNTTPSRRDGSASSLTYDVIKENIDPGGEITSVPVYQELFKTAQLFGVDSTEARTAVLYPGREPLESRVREGVLQRLLAAWFFIMSWYEDERIISEDLLFKNTESIALNLLDLLKEIESDQDKADTGKINVSALRKNVYRTLTSYRRQREGLVQVKRLMEYAKASKVEGEFEDAIKDLKKAVELLLPVYKRIDDTNYKISISQEIADCYGMMGGIYRRQAKRDGNRVYLEKSAEMYEEGLKYEIDDSYNLSNSIVLQILVNPENLEKLQGEITQGIQTLQKQVRGKRRDQWWAWSDLGLFYLLIGDLTSSLDSYIYFTQLGARAQDQGSVIGVLEELRGALDGVTSPFAKQVTQSITTTVGELRRKKPR